MSDAKFKTMRHIETVRNYLNAVVKELLNRAEKHDQTKLTSPEVDVFEKYTPLLRNCTYGSEKYKKMMSEMKPALEYHYKYNRHHPEYFGYYECNGCFQKFYGDHPDSCDICHYSQFQYRESNVAAMNLFDIIEMLCDWKAATLRHNDGDIQHSISINKKRFGYSDELESILLNTVIYMDNNFQVFNKADES